MKPSLALAEIIQALESHAPLSLQESYDNSGLQVGNSQQMIHKALLSLDVTEEVLEEAKAKGCNLVISHHPILFKGLKKITGQHYTERIVYKAIKEDIAIYAIHTNLDHVLRGGVNEVIAKKLGLAKIQALSLVGVWYKLEVFVPESHLQALTSALFAAGAGKIGQYDECGFTTVGTGTFRPLEGANPYSGEHGARSEVSEIKLEVVVPQSSMAGVIKAMKEAHPYEEVAHYITLLHGHNPDFGAGAIGYLEEPLKPEHFLSMLKERMGAQVVKYTQFNGGSIHKVAVCGGAGSFLLSQAKAMGADAFVTSDVKYHEFFEADGKLMYCDIGHYETEQFTGEAIANILLEKFPTFATIFAQSRTNPVKYF